MATETTDDAKVVELCLDGFKHAIHCSGVLGMTTERAAFVTTLCNFTTLEPAGGGVRACTPRPCPLLVWLVGALHWVFGAPTPVGHVSVSDLTVIFGL